MITRTFIKNEGFKYTFNNKSLIVAAMSSTKENHHLTESQIESFIKSTSEAFDQIKHKKRLLDFFTDLSYVVDESKHYDEPFYKFVKKEDFNNYISKGKHRLGTLQDYREIEKKESRDEKEGFSNLIINSGGRQITASVISGFDKYILCGTSNLDNLEFMTENFGDYVLKIKNIKSFADKTAKVIGASDWHVQKVRYSDYKAYKTDIEIKDLDGVSPDLSQEMFDILYRISETPSVFCKPERFSPEQEVRLSFNMGRDVKMKFLNFDNKGLLDEIEVLEI